MAHRRYHIQLSVFEGGMLVAGFVLASVLIFVFGMYIGKEVQAQKIAHQAQPLRVPVVLSKNQILSRPSATASLPAARLTAPPISEPPPERREPSSAVIKERAGRKLPKRQAKLPTPPPEPLRRKAASSTEKPIEAPSVAPVPPKPPVAPVPPKPPQKPAKKQDTKPTQWSVQVQATSKEKAALQLAQQLRRLGYTPMLSKIHREGRVLYRVRVGPFTTEGDAKAAIARFQREKTFAQAYLVSH